MTDITELAQSHELLIANGQQTADLLRHLADNEIDSDYFAVVSECESYGKETDVELSITEFALRAAGYVDALVEELEKAQQNETQASEMAVQLSKRLTAAENRISELENYAEAEAVGADKAAEDSVYWMKRCKELESRTVTVKLPAKIERNDIDGWLMYKGGRIGGGAAEWYNKALDDVGSELTDAGIKWEAE